MRRQRVGCKTSRKSMRAHCPRCCKESTRLSNVEDLAPSGKACCRAAFAPERRLIRLRWCQQQCEKKCHPSMSQAQNWPNASTCQPIRIKRLGEEPCLDIGCLSDWRQVQWEHPWGVLQSFQHASPKMGVQAEHSDADSHFLFCDGGFLAQKTIGSMRVKCDQHHKSFGVGTVVPLVGIKSSVSCLFNLVHVVQPVHRCHASSKTLSLMCKCMTSFGSRPSLLI